MNRNKVEIERIYPLSPMQESMLLHWGSNRTSSLYFLQNIFTINGDVEKFIFEKSFNILVQRYDIFRTIYRYENVKQPIQIVLKTRSFKVYFEDISHLEGEEQEKWVEDFTRKDRERGFDLTRDLLMRASLFKTGESQYNLVWSYHHILMDGWCMNIIFRDLMQIYFSLKDGKTFNFRPVIPYRNYIKWLYKQDKEKGINFWKEYLNGYDNPIGLTKFGKEINTSNHEKYRKDEYDHVINMQMTASLNKIARDNQVTDNIIFQALWGILLHLYNDAEDIVYGIVVSGRPPEVEEIENMVGLFINTVPIRITIDPEATFSQMIKEIQQKSALTKPYEFIPLAEIQVISSLKDHLIDHIVGYENYPPIAKEFKYIAQTGKFHLYGSSLRLNHQPYYNFNLAVVPGEETLLGFFFNANVFDKNFIRKIGAHLDEIILQVVENPDSKIQDLAISGDLSKAISSFPQDEYINFEF